MGTKNEIPEPDCQEQFQAAVRVIQNLPKNSDGYYRPSYEEMLRFYSYYKQATMGPCQAPRPGFWDPIGRYKWDAWNSLGKMSREEAMSAYIAEMKVVAQKVIDTVPLGEVADDIFGYFEPLYRLIPDMPRPPETFLRRVTGWKEQVPNGNAGAAPEPPCLPKEPAPPSPGQWLGRRGRGSNAGQDWGDIQVGEGEAGCYAVPTIPHAHRQRPPMLQGKPGGRFWDSCSWASCLGPICASCSSISIASAQCFAPPLPP